MGIGALLADGIGDTIRVSLTRPRAQEIPVARMLAEHFASRPGVFEVRFTPERYSPDRLPAPLARHRPGDPRRSRSTDSASWNPPQAIRRPSCAPQS